ncbi:MAG: hypothetical protein RIT14_854 [Pseudomonadota bacterium]|jgi:PAS domain S-box-containing protein
MAERVAHPVNSTTVSWFRTIRWGGTLLMVAFCLISILLLAQDVRKRLEALERANSDNAQWVMMQTEVEVLRLQTAVLQALEEKTPTGQSRALEEVRRWFNVLFSRVSMLEESEVYAPLLAKDEYAGDHGALRSYLDRTVPLIDGSDAGLTGALERMAQELPGLRMAARSITLKALSDFAAQSDLQRESISQTLVRLAILTGALIFMLTALALVMSRLYRTSEAQAEEVRQTGGRLSTIVANSADGIVVTDPNGLIQEFNPAAQAIFGLERAQVLGANALDLLFAEDAEGGQRAALITALEEMAPGKGPLRVEVDALRGDGSTFPAEVSIALSRPAGGSLIVAFVRDISDRRKTQRELTDALDRALAGEKAKAEFLAVMSHEMRTPLNGLIGSMTLLSDTRLDPAQRELLEVMEASGDILLGHVNSVLDISRAEAGAMRMREARFDVDRLVEEAVANQAGLAATAGNEMGIVALSGRIGRVQGDRGRIRQILLNLIGNAVKFTRHGKITVETEVLGAEEPDSSRVLVEFRVIDTGIGISETDLARIFEDFVTLDASYDRAAGGTGLGLGIARRLAEAMGGEIGAESVEGEGSLFWLRLPLARIATVTGADGVSADDPAPAGVADEDAPEDLPADVPAMPPMSILVVEDNEINRFLLRRYLEAVGHRVTEAVDGIEGVTVAERERFDVILMDISMPRLDGIEATRRIRAGSGLSAQSRILALTAHALPEEQARFREAGMEAGLTKPIGRTDLLRALAGVVPARAAAPAPAEDPVVDRTSLTELVGQIGADTATLLVRRLMEEGEALVGRVLAMALETDTALIAKECHQLAGTCGTFGTRRLRAVLSGIEAAIARQNLDEAARLLSGLAEVWGQTRAALEAEAQAFAPAD